ncbi:MAG: hypothetical protein GY754_30800 [bacterium]|nr:hypothetical protein [bacterium]
MNYKHTQTGILIIILLLITILITGGSLIPTWNMSAPGLGWVRWTLVGTMALLLLALVTFYSLTVTVDAAEITLKFGIGIVSKKIPISGIASCEAVKNKWIYGYGIRYIGDGVWMYNIQGNDAVELTLKEGKKFRIGTDEPAELLRVIREQL